MSLGLFMVLRIVFLALGPSAAHKGLRNVPHSYLQTEMLLPIRLISIWEPELLTIVKLLRGVHLKMSAYAIEENDSRRSNSKTVILSTGD